ncbi:MAG: dethiobiotin synthase [Gammaproteobacteria bacterium]|nr:dethiobiotin synthase [Gammaproteobacteria bacterium]
MNRGWFITGTDTGVGKTRVSCLLLRALVGAGKSTVGMKPVASGCQSTESGWRSDDALELMQAGNVRIDYADANPYALASACAPHLAAQEMGVEIRLEKILDDFERLKEKSSWVVVEGVGGWRVPLGEKLTIADVARAMQLPVILVVGLRLGCLNHALLTVEAIRRDGLELAGWVANAIDPAMSHAQENVQTLEKRLPAPLLASFPYRPSGNDVDSSYGFSKQTIMHLTQITD